MYQVLVEVEFAQADACALHGGQHGLGLRYGQHRLVKRMQLDDAPARGQEFRRQHQLLNAQPGMAASLIGPHQGLGASQQCSLLLQACVQCFGQALVRAHIQPLGTGIPGSLYPALFVQNQHGCAGMLHIETQGIFL